MEYPEQSLHKELGARLTLKENLIGLPTQYIENKVSQVNIENGTQCWDF